MGDFGRELSYKRARETVMWRIEGENCDGTDFKMGSLQLYQSLVNGLHYHLHLECAGADLISPE